ncbi:PQQ-binding-like beta-propeller repeat protein [uncultured Gimesia sp.]|uniref:outer membrane protein assembly factor BamB family protein n=1 Tax=uncultured Gimesia sp. TaxID=1678688 RepID=UPI00260832D8|nr:PQQ-binding-like beta-propeller repeat protein [uncultured Gimesia sp.]
MLNMGAHFKLIQLKLLWLQMLAWGTLFAPLCVTEPLSAQIFVGEARAVAADAAGNDGTSPHKMPGFSISVDEKKLNLLDDYERYVRHRMWEKALTTIKELSETKSTSPLLPTTEGFLVDAEDRIFMALISLPAEGREAFRLFFDGKARKQFEELPSQSEFKTPQAISDAKKIFSQFFLTSVGDDVADLLGNDAFERGEFTRAARYWRLILDHHPDTNLVEIDINVKYALALIRSRQSDQAASNIQVISQQFPGKKITLGGNSADPVVYLKSLIAQEPVKAAPSLNLADTVPRLISQPVKLQQPENKPRWKLTYLDKTASQAIVKSQTDYYGRGKSYLTFVPAMAVDEKRAYINFYGVCFALDLQSGKLVWRNAKFTDLGKHFSNYSFHRSSKLKQYHITVSGNTLLATLVPEKEMNQSRAAYRLVAYQADSGKTLWTAKVGTESFISKPLVEGNHIYVVSHAQNNKLIKLNSLSLKTGQKEWSIPLGSVVSGNSNNGMQIMPVPLLQKQGDSLFILTNNGALFEVSIPLKTINWVFRYPYKSNQTNTNYYYYAIKEETELHTNGQMIRDQNLLYFKEAGANEVYALDLSAKKVIWKRPVKVSAQIVGVDQKNVYIMSKELEAIDRKSRKLNWAVSLPVAAGGLSALIDPNDAWVFTSRGIFEISKTNGDIVNIYRGSDLTSLGGAIDLRNGLLICVSNQAVTAYPISTQQSKKDVGNKKIAPKNSNLLNN